MGVVLGRQCEKLGFAGGEDVGVRAGREENTAVTHGKKYQTRAETEVVDFVP